MAIASVLLGVLSLLMMFGGIFLFWAPVVGSLLSFGGPVLALVGIVLGGLAMSRAKQEGNPSGAALAGVILNVLGFLFGLLVAMTCGLCNAACTTAMMNGHVVDGGGWQGNLQLGDDGGTFGPLPPDPLVAPPSGDVPPSPDTSGGLAPPPAFPPPPPALPEPERVPAGPSGGMDPTLTPPPLATPRTSLAPPPPGLRPGDNLAPPPP